MRRFRNAVLQLLRDMIQDASPSSSTVQNGREQVSVTRLGNGIKRLSPDLSIMRPGRIIIVKVDRSGGAGHLLNCWRLLEQDWVMNTGTVLLIHVFILPLRREGRARPDSWDFCLEKARRALGNRFNALRVTLVRPPSLDCHADVPEDLIARCRAQLKEQGIFGRFRQCLTVEDPRDPARGDLPPVTLASQRTRGN